MVKSKQQSRRSPPGCQPASRPLLPAKPKLPGVRARSCMAQGLLLQVVLLAALATSWTYGGQSPALSTASTKPVRVWVDRSYYIVGETEILEDIVAGSNGRLTVNPPNNSVGAKHATACCMLHTCPTTLQDSHAAATVCSEQCPTAAVATPHHGYQRAEACRLQPATQHVQPECDTHPQAPTSC
jgi:hypothetical protein